MRKALGLVIVLALMASGLSAQGAWKASEKVDEATGARRDTAEALAAFRQNETLGPYFEQAVGFVVFPSVAKAGFGIGGAYGKGQLFEAGTVIGESSVTQLSIGLQLGGQAYSEIIFFRDARALETFKTGKFELGAQAGAVLIKEGVSVETAFNEGIAVFTAAKGGVMYEASLSGQKFSYRSLD
jgi:lipid-binding SYLF domain-containing protein